MLLINLRHTKKKRCQTIDIEKRKQVLTYYAPCGIMLTESTDDGCLPTEQLKELTAHDWQSRRLILFVMIVYVSKKCYYESCEQEQQFPCNEHWHHLPSREGKKNLRSRLREATATVYGALRVLDVPNIFYHIRHKMSIYNRYR